MRPTLSFSSAPTALFIYLIILTLLYFHGRTHFYRDPGSIFFDETRAYVKWYSHVREAESRIFLSLANPTSNGAPIRTSKEGGGGKASSEEGQEGIHSSSNNAESKKPSTCAIFVTMKRDGEQYLELALSSMLDDLTPAERRDIHIAVLFAHRDPNVHPTWSQPWLRNLVDSAISYDIFYGTENSSDAGNRPLSLLTRSSAAWEAFEYLSDLERSGRYLLKGVRDYAMALEYCYAVGTPLVAVFEDDILFARSWYARLRTALEGPTTQDKKARSEDKMQPPTSGETSTVQNAHDHSSQPSPAKRAFPPYTPPSTNPWLYTRLFNTEIATGWAGHGPFSHNELLISFAISLIVSAAAIFLRHRIPALRHILDNTVLALTATFFIPTCVCLFFASGKASLFPPSPGLRAEPFGCCSQALVYPRESVLGLASYLRNEGSGQVDLLVNRYARQEGLERWSLYPVMVQHRGLNSVRQTTVQDARRVWSMAFEELRGETLRSEQEAFDGLGWEA